MRLIILMSILLKINCAEYIKVKALTTAYCPESCCCGNQADSKTASGVDTDKVRWGIAADTSLLPFGTKIIVPGYKPSKSIEDFEEWSVDDTGGFTTEAREKSILHLDLRYIHHSSGVKYGKKYIYIYINTENLTEKQILKLKNLKDPK